mgnify:CR=1 FL=1
MKKILLIAVLQLFIALAVVLYLVYNGYIWFNNPSEKDFPIRGIDISNHQGKIDWKKLKKENFKFVYIKATEGKDYKDQFFNENWKHAQEIGLHRGAYHFFTFGSTGQEQAKNFVESVPPEKGCLPPVIDLEFGGNSKKVPERDKLRKELNDFIKVIQYTYKQDPIIYVTYDAYNSYLEGDYQDKKIWIRDILKYPRIKDNRDWVIWQYCSRGRVGGVNGPTDLNVFKGSNSELKSLLSK